jgi:predicted DNA-binding mobile mystery protein A
MARKLQPRVARQITRQLDDILAAVHLPPRPRIGWIASVRQALGMSKTQLAKRVDITRPSLDELESNELKETITLASMRRIADALGCDVQYILVPRKPLEQMIAERAMKKASTKLGRVNQSQALEASALEAASLSGAVVDLAQEYEVNRPADLWND